MNTIERARRALANEKAIQRRLLVQRIREMIDQNVPYEEIAKRTGVPESTVRVLFGKIW